MCETRCRALDADVCRVVWLSGLVLRDTSGARLANWVGTAARNASRSVSKTHCTTVETESRVIDLGRVTGSHIMVNLLITRMLPLPLLLSSGFLDTFWNW